MSDKAADLHYNYFIYYCTNTGKVKELFSYYKPGYQHNQEQILVLKVANDSIGFVVTEQSASQLYAVVSCRINDMDENTLDKFTTAYPTLSASYKETRIILDTPYSVLCSQEEALSPEGLIQLTTLHGFPSSEPIAADLVPMQRLKNAYALPSSVSKWAEASFSFVSIKHALSVALTSLGTGYPEGKLLTDFGSSTFSVIAASGNRFLFAGTFEYETPQDVLFSLLKICKEYSFSAKAVSLQLSGLIEKDSSLYKELYQYFLLVGFCDATWGPAGDYPAHFFTSYNDMAVCVL
jgi:hypothetical protein